jgi:hypothetical protein
VLLSAILAMVAGTNSYRQMHEFIRAHRLRLYDAFGLKLPYTPSYTGLRRILQGIDPAASEAAFRRHAASVPKPPAEEGLTPIAVDGKTLRGSFDAFNDRKAAHMMSALRHADRIVLAHVMVGRKEQRDSHRAGADRSAGIEELPVHARRRALSRKLFERVIASGNHLLTQVKGWPRRDWCLLEEARRATCCPCRRKGFVNWAGTVRVFHSRRGRGRRASLVRPLRPER